MITVLSGACNSIDVESILELKYSGKIICFMLFKGPYTLQKIFHGTENLPWNAFAVRFFLKKKSYCAYGPRKISRSVENFLKCICTFRIYLVVTFSKYATWS